MNMYGLPDAGGVAQVPEGWDHWYGQVRVAAFVASQVLILSRLETPSSTITVCLSMERKRSTGTIMRMITTQT